MNKIIHNQEKQYYEAIGKFVVYFEECCANIRSNIIRHISRSTGVDQNYIRILLNRMAAEELRSSYVALLNHSTDFDQFEEKVLKNITTRFQKLISIRNEFLHANWLLGQGIFSHGLSVSRVKWKNTGKGQELLRTEISYHEIIDLAYEAFNLSDLLHMFQICLIIPNNKGAIARNFCFDNKEVIIIKNKNVKRQDSGFEKRQNTLIGIKGTFDSELKIIARNTLDVIYIIMADNESCNWGNFGSGLDIISSKPNLKDVNLDNTLKPGMVLIFKDKKWIQINYDWFPNENEPIPDFSKI